MNCTLAIFTQRGSWLQASLSNQLGLAKTKTTSAVPNTANQAPYPYAIWASDTH